MSRRRSSRLQLEETETSSPAKNNGKNSNKSTPKRGKNTKVEKDTPNSKEKKSSSDEKNTLETTKNNRRKSDQKLNNTNTSTDKSANGTPQKRGQKRKAPSDENEDEPKNKRQKMSDKLIEEDDVVPFEESSSSQRRRSGKSVEERADEILDIRAEQWADIDKFDLSGTQDTTRNEDTIVYDQSSADVKKTPKQKKQATTDSNSNGKKVKFGAYADLLGGGAAPLDRSEPNDLSFLTPEDNEPNEQERKRRAYFARLTEELKPLNDEEKKMVLQRLLHKSLLKKRKENPNYPLQSTPATTKPKKAPQTAPVPRTNSLRDPTSPTKFKERTSNSKTRKNQTEDDNTQNNNDRMDVVAEENASPERKTTTPSNAKGTNKSATTTSKKGSMTPKSTPKAATNKAASLSPAKTPAKSTKSNEKSTPKTPKNTPSTSKKTPSKAKATPNKAKSSPSKVSAASPKKVSPKKSAKPTRARTRPTRVSL